MRNEKITYEEQAIDSLPIITAFEKYDFLKELKKGFNIAYEKLKNTFEHNIQLLRDKYKSPSIQITLEDSMELLNATNKIIDDANKLIGEFNTKITQKEKVLQALKEDFWNIQRFEYDQTIDSYKEDKIKSETELQRIRKEVSDIDKLISVQKEIILTEQKNVVNIDDAVNSINAELINLGIDNFKIVKYSDSLYHIAREDDSHQVFKSLSEGEKMIISFLYFVELCRGKQSANNITKKRIIVIDDPISSLSHIYVFNIGTLIQKEFLTPEAPYVRMRPVRAIWI